MKEEFELKLKRMDDGECTHVRYGVEHSDPEVSITFMMLADAGKLVGIHYAVIEHNEIMYAPGEPKMRFKSIYHFFQLTDQGRADAVHKFLSLAEKAKETKKERMMVLDTVITGDFMTFGPQDEFGPPQAL